MTLQSAAAQCADHIKKHESALVVSHIDADGLTSAAIMGKALERAGIEYGTRFVKQLDMNALTEIADQNPELVIFTDLGSGMLDDFIKRKLLAEYPDKLTDNDVLVVHHPISPFSAANLPIKSVQSVCFIGYRTRFKNFEQFKQLSDLIPHVSFMAIGDGIVEDLRLARTFPISGTDDYLLKISECSIAVFPYNSGYTCSLPASVLDALSTGVYIIASDRPAFTSLQEYLGPEFITIFCSNSESLVFLSDTQWIEQKRSGKARRLEKLLKSKYGPDAVRASFEKIILAQTLP